MGSVVGAKVGVWVPENKSEVVVFGSQSIEVGKMRKKSIFFNMVDLANLVVIEYSLLNTHCL